VMALGENIAAEDVGAEDCILVRHAPQLELLGRAKLCVTHAGLNTALESLSAGVPMVAIPITNDQPGVAARIAYTRTGVVVPYARVNAERLRAAVTGVMGDARFAANARRMAENFRAANGLEHAVEIIERTIVKGR